MPHVVTLIRSASLSSVAEYAYAATAPPGSRLIFLAGACPLNDDGSTAAVGDYTGQAVKAFENMRTALADAGASIEDVLCTRVLVASSWQQDLVAAWEVVRDSFGEHDVPSTLMGVTVLGYTDQLVEIEAVAAVVDSIRCLRRQSRIARPAPPPRPTSANPAVSWTTRNRSICFRSANRSGAPRTRSGHAEWTAPRKA